MKINKSSWHYKFLNFAGWDEFDIPNNLCKYFWTVVLFAPSFVMFIALLVTFMVSVFVGLPISLALDLFFPILDLGFHTLALIVVMVEIALLTCRVIYLIYDGIRDKRKFRGLPPKNKFTCRIS